MARKHTKAQYARLHTNPEILFPGVRVTLWPNGIPEIWARTSDGLGFRLSLSNGPHGLGLKVDTFAGTPDVSTYGEDTTNLEVTQYRQTETALAFKRWYRHQETADDVRLLGPAYDRKKFCPECDSYLTTRTRTAEGKPAYCDECDREVLPEGE